MNSTPLKPPLEVDNFPRTRSVVQVVCDLLTVGALDVRELSVVDLGSAHGSYTLEFSRRGARATGIEGRQAWVDHAQQRQARAGIAGATFVCDDARNLSASKYGQFDVTLCLGLLYHLDAPDNLELLARLHEVTDRFAVIDTQVATNQPREARQWRGKTYFGWPYREHSEGSTEEAREANIGASLRDDFSFWLSAASLRNALAHVGFSSVVEVLNPLGCMYVGSEMKLHADVVTYVAFKGKPVTEIVYKDHLRAPGEPDDWPEDPAPYYMERPWSTPEKDPAKTDPDPTTPASSRRAKWKFWAR